MVTGKNIEIEEYNYYLPDERIAKYPLENRDQSKLLFFNKGLISHDIFSTLPKIVKPGRLMVYNNTKVIQARLFFYKETGAKIEIFCLEPHLPVDFEQNFSQTCSCSWKCIVGNLKKWKVGTLKGNFVCNGTDLELEARRIESCENYHIIEFSWSSGLSFSEMLDFMGKTPIPPYLNRESEIDDKNRYQTVYSQHKGSVAAPTAGLHFTAEVLERLRANQVQVAELTLHVGAGTFRPVQAQKVGGHTMHTEHFFFSQKLVSVLIENIGNILAVGTTSVRTLESLYWLGVKIINKQINKTSELNILQWETYENIADFSTVEAFEALLNFMQEKNIDTAEATTQIIIVPGYKFRVVNEMITNFHMPKSTLLLLIAAFVGSKWKNIYQYAMEQNFRFLSYGDSSLLIPEND